MHATHSARLQHEADALLTSSSNFQAPVTVHILLSLLSGVVRRVPKDFVRRAFVMFSLNFQGMLAPVIQHFPSLTKNARDFLAR